MCNIAAKWENVQEKKPLTWLNIFSKYICTVVKCKAKQSRTCPQSQHLHLHPELIHLSICNMCSWERPCDEHVCREIKGHGFLSAWTHWKCRDHIFLVWSRNVVSLQEALQRRLVNRKQAHLVRVAFYGLTDSNSISREPEEDEFLSFGLIEWLIWFVTRVCVLCDIEP